MSFYNDLQKARSKRERTCSEVIESKYQQNLNYIFEALKDRCRWANERGERRLYGWTYIENDRDYGENGIWLKWRSSIEYPKVETPQQWFARTSRDWSGWDRKKLEERSFEKCFPMLTKQQRDRFLRDLQRMLIREGFPASCVRAVDVPIELPDAVSFWTGKPTSCKRYGTYYGIEMRIAW